MKAVKLRDEVKAEVWRALRRLPSIYATAVVHEHATELMEVIDRVFDADVCRQVDEGRTVVVHKVSR